MEAVILEPGAQKGALLHAKGEPMRLLKNMDTSTNNVYLGDQELFDLSGLEFSTLRPLGTLVVTGEKDLYGLVSPTGSAVKVEKMEAVLSTPAPSDEALQIAASGLMLDTTGHTINSTLGVPAQTVDVNNLHTAGHTVANEISTTGAPLLRLSTNLANQNGQTVVGNSAANILLNQSLNQIAFQMFVSVRFALSVGTIPFAKLIFTWIDGPSGTILGQDEVYLACANSTPNNTYQILGPLRGDKLTLVIQNLDPLQTLNYSYSISQTSHPFTQLRAIEWNYVTPPNGFNAPGFDVPNGILCSTAPTVNAGTTVTRLPAMWAGKAMLVIDNLASANAITVSLTDPANLYSMSGSQSFVTRIVTSGGFDIVPVELPNGPVLLVMKNVSAGAATPTVTLMRMEYEQ